MSRAESKERTRERLLDSARTVFADKGFTAATVEDIAAGAGFTRGAFYANFEDKADCFWSLVETQETASFAQLGDLVAAAADSDQQLEVVGQWFGGLMAVPGLDRAFSEVLANPKDERSRERLAAIQTSHREAIARVIQQQADAYGFTLNVPVDDLALAFLGLGQGLLSLNQLLPGGVPTSLFADAMSWLFLGAAAPTDGS